MACKDVGKTVSVAWHNLDYWSVLQLTPKKDAGALQETSILHQYVIREV